VVEQSLQIAVVNCTFKIALVNCNCKNVIVQSGACIACVCASHALRQKLSARADQSFPILGQRALH
jgi:hypothetical protein